LQDDIALIARVLPLLPQSGGVNIGTATPVALLVDPNSTIFTLNGSSSTAVNVTATARGSVEGLISR